MFRTTREKMHLVKVNSYGSKTAAMIEWLEEVLTSDLGSHFFLVT